MKLNFNVKNRKEFVKAISEITGEQAVYQFTPTYAFKIGDLTVNRDSTLSVKDDDPRLEIIISELEKRGYHMQDSPVRSIDTMPQERTGNASSDAFTVSVPADKANPDLLKAIIGSRKHLIMKALNASSTEIKVTDDKIEFPWFDRKLTADEVDAFTTFISLLCRFSKELKRCNAKEHPIENEKYTFRTFLLRLGFIGPEFKAFRKLLLKNLDGNSAFRHPEKC